MDLYRHQGAWGLWYLPGEARLHPLSSRSVTSQRATGLHPVQDCTSAPPMPLASHSCLLLLPHHAAASHSCHNCFILFILPPHACRPTLLRVSLAAAAAAAALRQ